MGLFDWLFKKTETPPMVNTWQVGERVLAKWNDSYFYPGMIREIAANMCLVVYDAGDGAWVHFAHIVRPDIHPGCRVFCRAHGGPAFYPGLVRQQKGETILVRYDHGEEEWTSISMVRVQRPIANVSPESMIGPSPFPIKQTIDLGAADKDTNWRVGDRVLARWVDFFWYPGTILAIGQHGLFILYDGGEQWVVQESSLMPLVIEEGERLFIRPKTEPQRVYVEAHVTRVHGEILDVEFDDGEHETNTRVSRARFWRCPVGIVGMPFDEGDRVLAYDSDGFMYPADIILIDHDEVTVQYFDGYERVLTPELVKRFDLRVGTVVDCRWSGGPHFFPGKIDKVEGERIHVKYDDNAEEWTTIRLVRLPPKPPV